MGALVIRYPEAGEPGRFARRVLHRSPVRMGRNPLNGLCLPHEWVSQWHGVFEFTDTNIRFSHIGKTNSTVANGQRLRQGDSADLGRKAELKIGPMKIWAEVEEIDQEAENQSLNTIWSNKVVRRSPQSKEGETEPGTQAGSPYAFRALGALQGETRELRMAWRRLRQKTVEVTRDLSDEDRDLVMEGLVQAVPEVANHPELTDLLQEVDAEIDDSPLRTSYDLIRQMAEVYVQNPPLPARSTELQDSMHQAAAALEVFSQGFVEAKNAYTEVARRMEISPTDARNPILKCLEAADVLQHVLHWQAPENARRLDELRSLIADISLHQFAMFEAFMAGVGALLGALSPNEISAEVGNKGLLGGAMGARWRKFSERHADFSEDQRTLHSVLFGREFRAAYYATVHQARDEKGLEAPAPAPAQPMGKGQTKVQLDQIEGDWEGDDDPTNSGDF